MGIFLDFDGTLSEIVPRPEMARPVPDAVETVTELTRRFRLVAVVSGRSREEVASLLGAEGVRYEGSYGLLRGSTDDLLAELEAAAGHVEGAWVEPKGVSAAIHYRAAADPRAAGATLAKLLSAVAASHGLEVIEGKMVLELVPAGSPRKGGVIERLATETSLEGALYAGDDAPDLEAFAALDRLAEDGVETVKVAVRGAETPDVLTSAADVVVDGPSGLVALLRSLL